MIVKVGNNKYKVHVLGGSKMKTLLFDPGPWSSANSNKEVIFKTIPEGWWGIDCKDFLGMAWLAVLALIRDKYWSVKRKVMGNA